MFRLGASVATLVLVASAAQAGEKPLYQPMPAWVKPAPAPAMKGDDAPAVMILDQQQRIEGGQVWAYMDTAVRIDSPQALAQAGTISLPWQPYEGDLIVHRAEILRGGETIDLIAGKQPLEVLRREQQLETLQMNGVLTATMAAEGLRLGDVLRLTYSVTRTDPVLSGKVQTILPLPPQPFRAGFGRARLMWRKDIDLATRTYVDGLALAPGEAGGYREIEVSLPIARQPEIPQDAPARFQKVPVLEATSFSDWADVSRAMAPLYATTGLIKDGSPLAQATDRIAGASADPVDRAAMALRLVQDEVRYLFQGMDGGNYRPQSPERTWEVRYGDCKAKTLLLLAMLHRLGIEAEAVLANSSLGEIVPMRLPMPAVFDHVLVRATIAGESYWLDGTGSGTRKPDLRDVPPLGHVLPLRVGGAAPEKLVLRPYARPMVSIALEIDQSAGVGIPSPYRVTAQVRGSGAELINAARGQVDAQQREEMVAGFLSSFIDTGLLADPGLAYDPETGIATVSASGVVSSGWSFEQGRYRREFDRTLAGLEFEPDRARAAWRNIPVAKPVGASVAFRTRVKLPDDGKGFVLEGDRQLPPELGGFAVTRSASLDGGWLTVEDRMDGLGGEIAPEGIAGVRSALALARSRMLRMLAPPDYPPRWKRVEGLRKSGRLKPVEAIYEAVAREPDDAAIAYANQLDFYRGIYDYERALRSADALIGVEPSAENRLRRIDLLERLGRTEPALAEAEALYREESGSDDVILMLARLRGDAGKVDEALALLDERIAAGGERKSGFLAMKAEILAGTKRTEEAEAVIDVAVREKPGSASLLNSRCWLRGTANTALDAALKDCTRAIELAETPVAALDSRALVYLRMNRLEEALGDADAALALNPEVPETLFIRAVVRKRLGQAGWQEDLHGARLMRPAIEGEYARYGLTF